MNYVNLAQEALSIFEDLIDSPTKKEKQIALDKVKGNEYAEELLKIAKDKDATLKDFALNGQSKLNEGRIQLTNLINFLEVVKSKIHSTEELINFVLRNADELEAKVYQAILTGGIALPVVKEQPKTTVKKQVEKEQAV